MELKRGNQKVSCPFIILQRTCQKQNDYQPCIWLSSRATTSLTNKAACTATEKYTINAEWP